MLKNRFSTINDLKDNKRLKFLQIAVCLGLLLGIFFSHELWFPLTRSFPRVPMFIESPVLVDRLLTIILIISLLSIMFSLQLKFFSVTAISSLVLLTLFDQMRLQPWVYQYLLLLIILTLHQWQREDESVSNQTLGLAQLIIAGLYFWSGLQKLNFTFSHESLPMLLEPLQSILPANTPFVWLGISIALLETFVGVGLLFRKTRNLSVCFAVVMHGIILALLIAKNYNSIVWIWNATLVVIVVIVFWKNDVSIRQLFITSNSNSWKIITAKVITIVSLLLPILSFADLWDMYLSGALYSGNVEVGVVKIDDAAFEKLPPKARETVFRTKSTNEQMLPLFEWAIAELNVPAYPQQRVFKKVALDVCRIATDKTRMELIIKERPAIFNGSYKVTRISCSELEKR